MASTNTEAGIIRDLRHLIVAGASEIGADRLYEELAKDLRLANATEDIVKILSRVAEQAGNLRQELENRLVLSPDMMHLAIVNSRSLSALLSEHALRLEKVAIELGYLREDGTINSAYTKEGVKECLTKDANSDTSH